MVDFEQIEFHTSESIIFLECEEYSSLLLITLIVSGFALVVFVWGFLL